MVKGHEAQVQWLSLGKAVFRQGEGGSGQKDKARPLLNAEVVGRRLQLKVMPIEDSSAIRGVETHESVRDPKVAR